MYLEAHITIEPIFDEDLERVKELLKDTPFKLADLFMQKSRSATPERSNKDTFMTAHSKGSKHWFGVDLQKTVKLLQSNGIIVYRYKIEEILIDSRSKDEYNLLTQ